MVYRRFIRLRRIQHFIAESLRGHSVQIFEILTYETVNATVCYGLYQRIGRKMWVIYAIILSLSFLIGLATLFILVLSLRFEGFKSIKYYPVYYLIFFGLSAIGFINL